MNFQSLSVQKFNMPMEELSQEQRDYLEEEVNEVNWNDGWD
jgi:hypothetical protein